MAPLREKVPPPLKNGPRSSTAIQYVGDSKTYITIEMIEITAQNLESLILAWPGLSSTFILARLGSI